MKSNGLVIVVQDDVMKGAVSCRLKLEEKFQILVSQTEAPMRGLHILPLLFLILSLVACTQPVSTHSSSMDSTSPHAAIVLRDGTTVTGIVTSSTPSQITLNMDTGGTVTILTKDVKSVDYGDAATAPSATPSVAQSATPVSYTAPDETAQNRSKPAPRPVPGNHPDQSAAQTRTFVIPAGALLSVRNDTPIDSSQAIQGQTYPAEVATDVRDAHGKVVIPRGARAQLVAKSVSKAGKIRGASELVLGVKSLSIDRRQYVVQTTDIREQGKKGIGKNKRTGKFVGGGAAAGGIIGAIAGGGKGLIIGGLSGATVGGAAQVLTRNKAIRIPAETLMTFRLETPIRIVERG
jgi:hypothetical protein